MMTSFNPVCFVLQKSGITYILNVSNTSPKPSHIPEGHFLRLPVNDNYVDKLLPLFAQAFQFLGACLCSSASPVTCPLLKHKHVLAMRSAEVKSHRYESSLVARG